VYRPSELFSHLMNSLQEGLPLWMQSFSLRVTTGHILHNRHLPDALFFLFSTGRGTTTSADIVSPWCRVLVFLLLVRFVKETYEFSLHINDTSVNDSENYNVEKLVDFNHYHCGSDVSRHGADIESVGAVRQGLPA
jgi:hypothetical protein